MTFETVTLPTVYPVEVSDLMAHCRITDSSEQEFLEGVIASATDYVQGFTGLQLIRATYRIRLPQFIDPIRFPQSPLASVTSVQYVDTAGATQTLSTDYYTADTYSNPGQIRRKYGMSWPQIREQDDAVIIEYVAGYGTTKDTVPHLIRHAVKTIAAHMYEHREPTIAGTIIAKVPSHVDDWLWQYRNVAMG